MCDPDRRNLKDDASNHVVANPTCPAAAGGAAVDPELAATGQTNEGQAAPTLVMERPLDRDSLAFELCHRAIDVFAE